MLRGTAKKYPETPDYATTMAAAAGACDPRPKLVVRPTFEVVWHSGGARELLQAPLPVQIERGCLKFSPHIRADGVQKFLEEATTTPRSCLLRSHRKGHWVLLRAWAIEAPHQMVGLVCSLSTPCRRVSETGLTEELNLTPTEARVLDLFAQLRPPKEIAEDLGISLTTVRSHLKQIYSKSMVESAVQLLQLTRAYCAN